jgi:FtsP/CotA-like multicopper oxidase with cupredoxin domain
MNMFKRVLLSASGLTLIFLVTQPAFSSATNTQDYLEIGSEPLTPGEPNKDYLPVVTPNGRTLDFKIVDGVKVFHLVAEEVNHEFAPGLKAKCWGYNNGVHGPTIEAVQGDRVRIYVTNKLPEATTVHWHGLIVPSGMDGVSGISQPPIGVGETFVYEFTLLQHGTFMYHSHHDSMTQEALGLTGMFIIHPRKQDERPKVDRDFVILLHEWRIDADTSRPNPLEMTDFNVLTMNGKVFPAAAPLVIKQGQRVRIRFGNLSSQDHHPIHFHGYEFNLTAEDGASIPPEHQRKGSTVLVAVGQTRDIEFVANNPGDWVFHCHMLHHMMNQMGHNFPNMIGINAEKVNSVMQKLIPDYMTMGETGMEPMMGMSLPKNTIAMLAPNGPFNVPIDMGGMANVMKVRPDITSYADPGWYKNPKGTQAWPATEEELSRDAIKVKVGKSNKMKAHMHHH